MVQYVLKMEIMCLQIIINLKYKIKKKDLVGYYTFNEILPIDHSNYKNHIINSPNISFSFDGYSAQF